MREYTTDSGMPQPLRTSVKAVLLRCVDMADTLNGERTMLLTMYETGLLSCAETFAHLVTRRLER